MFIGAVKYFIKNKFNVIRNDFAQYVQLRRECGNLRHECVSARANLAPVAYMGDGELLTPTCMKQFLMPDSMRIDSDASVTCAYVVTCQNFVKCISENKPCGNSQCALYARNQRFFAVLEQYNAAYDKKSDFWRGKFANEK